MALALNAPLGGVITDEGRVDAKALARQIDVSVPTIARVLGKSPRFLNDYPTAKSAQRRALTLVDRVNDLAGELGGLKFAIVWLKTPMRELGGRSALEALAGTDDAFATAIGFIDDFLNAVPD
jgi:hypothetical protein